MNYQEIRCSVADGVALITLCRPESCNAYTPDMGDELVHALRAAAADDGVCSAVITGEGETFCAGADRACLQGKLSRSGKALGEEEFIASFTEEFAALPILTVVAINGAAAGIGITGMLAADIRICAADAKLVLNFAELGIVPGMGSTYFLPRLLGSSAATELLLARRRISGSEAAEIGLVSAALPAPEVLPRAMELARGAAGCKPGMIELIKRGIGAGSQSTLGEALTMERILSREVKR